MFHDRQFQTFQGLPLFPKQFQFSKIQGLFETGLKFKTGVGTLHNVYPSVSADNDSAFPLLNEKRQDES